MRLPASCARLHSEVNELRACALYERPLATPRRPVASLPAGPESGGWWSLKRPPPWRGVPWFMPPWCSPRGRVRDPPPPSLPPRPRIEMPRGGHRTSSSALELTRGRAGSKAQRPWLTGPLGSQRPAVRAPGAVISKSHRAVYVHSVAEKKAGSFIGHWWRSWVLSGRKTAVELIHAAADACPSATDNGNTQGCEAGKRSYCFTKSLKYPPQTPKDRLYRKPPHTNGGLRVSSPHAQKRACPARDLSATQSHPTRITQRSRRYRSWRFPCRHSVGRRGRG